MSIPHSTALENLTLTETDLAACRPQPGEGGRVLRAFCPFHGSDHQRSLRVTLATGRFVCFACGAWGYLEASRQRWSDERSRRTATWKPAARQRRSHRSPQRTPLPEPLRPVPGSSEKSEPASASPDLTHRLATFQAALPRSPGEAYLRQRGISLPLAQSAGVGYATPGTWPHPTRDWKEGRLVFPHTDPDGHVVNLYGRAVETTDQVPKAKHHDHLPGRKGYFNAMALREGEGPLFVCEGAFDALSLIAAGIPRVVAIFGVHGWRWDWARRVQALVLALDADAAGQRQWRALARQAVLRGKQVAVLTPDAYGGYTDVNEAWVAGTLHVEDCPATAVAGTARRQRPADLGV